LAIAYGALLGPGRVAVGDEMTTMRPQPLACRRGTNACARCHVVQRCCRSISSAWLAADSTTVLPPVNSRTLMYQRCAANVYRKNGRTHCETLRSGPNGDRHLLASIGRLYGHRKRSRPDGLKAVIAVVVVVEAVGKCVTAVFLAVMHLSTSLVWRTVRRSWQSRRAHYAWCAWAR
jgi:hypothetical protein